MLKEFYDEDNELVALVIGSRFEKEGIEFFTPGDFSQQLGYVHHQKGKVIAPYHDWCNKIKPYQPLK